MPPEEPEPEVEEEDPDAPKLEDMINERREKLQQQWDADVAKIEELTETFKILNIPVIPIEANRDMKAVFDRVT